MTGPVNLNKVRKTRKRADAKQKADQNAVKFGRTKAQRLHDATQAEAAKRRLDQLKFDDD